MFEKNFISCLREKKAWLWTYDNVNIEQNEEVNRKKQNKAVFTGEMRRQRYNPFYKFDQIMVFEIHVSDLINLMFSQIFRY